MNVTSINGSSYAASSMQSNAQIKAIDKQISELQKSIQAIRQDKSADAKSKSEKIKAYQEQIAQLQQQKAEVQAQARKAQQSSAKSESASVEQEQANEQQPAIDTLTQKSLMEMDNATKMQRQTGGVRADLEGEIRIAESKSYLRETSPAVAAEARGKINFLDSTISGKLEHAAEGLEKAGSVEKTSEVNKTAETESPDSADDSEANATEHEKHHGTGRMEPGQFLYEEI